jgi:hypothetical protein
MDTCSNCGSAVRPGAKFCTACGTRLNDVDTSNTGTSGWAVGPSVEDTPSATEPTADDDESTRKGSRESSETPPVATSTPATAWQWGSSVSDNPAERTPITQVDDEASASAGAAEDVQASPASPGNFQWSWDSPSAPEADESRENGEMASDAVPTDGSPGTAEAYERDNADSPQGAEVVEHGENGDDESTAEDLVGLEDREAEIADAAPPYDWRRSVYYSYQEKSPTLGESGVGMPTEAESDEATAAVFDDSDGHGSSLTDSTDVQARAGELLDELRSLIPALGSTTGADPGTSGVEPSGAMLDTQGLIADLESATSGVSSSDDLRSVLESAQSRPRDMDVVLELVGRAGSLIDLLDERDRLAAAIERTLSGLRS